MFVGTREPIKSLDDAIREKLGSTYAEYMSRLQAREQIAKESRRKSEILRELATQWLIQVQRVDPGDFQVNAFYDAEEDRGYVSWELGLSSIHMVADIHITEKDGWASIDVRGDVKFVGKRGHESAKEFDSFVDAAIYALGISDPSVGGGEK
jgi:hypothetical protein